MISIEDAIKKAKEHHNISVGGSVCYDFGDTVLVKYTLDLKYAKDGYRARNNQEIVMKGINDKNHKGVNTPKHYDMKRVVEGENDVCYVLQEKCKGRNCATMAKHGETLEVVMKQLKYVNDIPFEHYVKLVSDACMLYEMGYESKNKNLFYDEETGFWFIDFLNNDEDKFDFNDPKKVFETIKYICPKPLQIVSTLSYDAKISEEDRKKHDYLRYAIKAKYFLACEKAIPTLKKYEIFYLLTEEDDFKQYLMSNDIINHNLFDITKKDLETYYELFSYIVDDICKEISIDGREYWNVSINDIRNKSSLFDLNIFYKKYICKDIKKEDFENEWEYSKAVNSAYVKDIMDSIYQKICSMDENENITKFISEYENRRKRI